MTSHQTDVSEAPITRDEIKAMFGDTIPMEVVALIWDSPGDMTIGQVRAAVRRLAPKPAGPTEDQGEDVLGMRKDD